MTKYTVTVEVILRIPYTVNLKQSESYPYQAMKCTVRQMYSEDELFFENDEMSIEKGCTQQWIDEVNLERSRG